MKTIQPRPGVVEAHLGRLPLFADLNAEDLAALASTASLRLYDRAEVLFHSGTPAHALFCVVHGSVRVLRMGPGGKEKVVHLLAAPGMVAEVPVLMGLDFPANAECNEACTVVVVPRAALRDLVGRDREIPMRLLAAAMGRLRELTRSLARHGERSAVGRVAAYLLGLAHYDAVVELPAAKKDVANYLGLQPESFSRALAALRKQGAIAVDDTEVRILDRALLERALSDP